VPESTRLATRSLESRQNAFLQSLIRHFSRRGVELLSARDFKKLLKHGPNLPRRDRVNSQTPACAQAKSFLEAKV